MKYVFVGSLYRSIPAEARSLVPADSCRVRKSTVDSFKSRCDLLNIEDDFRVNLLAYDVGILKGFLTTRDKSYKTTSAVLSVQLKTTQEALDIDNKDLQQLAIAEGYGDREATHVVIGVQWGANAMVKCRTTADCVAKAKSTSAKLKSALAEVAAELTNNINKESSVRVKNNHFFENFKFEFYGDAMPADDEPGSIEEVIQYLHKVKRGLVRISFDYVV